VKYWVLYVAIALYVSLRFGKSQGANKLYHLPYIMGASMLFQLLHTFGGRRSGLQALTLTVMLNYVQFCSLTCGTSLSLSQCIYCLASLLAIIITSESWKGKKLNCSVFGYLWEWRMEKSEELTLNLQNTKKEFKFKNMLQNTDFWVFSYSPLLCARNYREMKKKAYLPLK